MVRSLDRWTPFVSVPRWYDAIALPCHLFSRDHDHVVATSWADHYRAPCGNRWIAPRAPTSVGWDDCCVPWGYKMGKPSCNVAIAKSRLLSSSTVSPLLLPRLVLANPLLVHLYCCFAHSPSNPVSHRRRPPPEEARRRPKEEPRLHRRPCPRSWRCLSPSAGRL
jgi:hypothetical protein